MSVPAPKQRLGDLAAFVSGGTPSKQIAAYWDGDTPWVSAKDLKSFRISSSIDTLSNEGRKVASLVPSETLLILVRGMSLFKSIPLGIATQELAINQDLKGLIAKGNVSASFLAYSLLARENALLQMVEAAGHGTGRLDTDALKDFMVRVPPREEQEGIVDVLATWDTAIERTEQLIALRAKQKAWLRAQVISSLGHTTKLGDFLKQESRPEPKPTEPYWALGIRSHGKGTFQRFVKDPASVEMEELYAVNRDNLIVNITFAWEGAIAFVKPEDERCLVSHRFPTYEVNNEIADPVFVKYIVNCKAFFSKLALISPGGAGRNRVLNKKDFLKLEVSLPPLAEQTRLAMILATTDLLIEKETSLLVALKSQKRGLMQKLLTGQWRVPMENNEVPA